MKTKFKHTSEIKSKTTNPIIELFFEFSQLKNLYRQGWLRNGVSNKDCESVADHSFMVALLGYFLAEEYRPDLDSSKVLHLGLFHEIGEIYAGDITPHDKITKEDKSKLEHDAVKKIFSKFKNSKKYIESWEEFEFQKSNEAVFVNQIDKLEMIMQAHLYEHLDYTNLNEFFEYVKYKINAPELKKTMKAVLKNRK